MPVFALFFPIEIAVALTAVVHLLNNLLKLALFAKQVARKVVLQFGIPAIGAAFLGARLLLWLAGLQPVFSYRLQSVTYHVMPVKLVVAILMLWFAVIESMPASRGLSFKPTLLPLGGLFSGLFGGLSGHQGAFRSAFLLRCGLSKESFIATGVAIACLVDLSRIAVYAPHFVGSTGEHAGTLLAAIASAFAGTYIGSRLLKKITMRVVQGTVAVMLVLIALSLGVGIL